MSTPPNDELWREALKAHEREDFDAEVVLREQLCEQFPKDMNCLHNLGLALLKQGNVDAAISTFEQVLERDPTVSRAHNNLAFALIQKGVDIQHLVPAFHTALLLSESYDDLIRHFVNLCISAALGCDQGNHELLDEIATTIDEVIEHCSGEADAKEEQLSQLLQILDAHRPLADYREAFASKRWHEVKESLQKARNAFESIGFFQRVWFIDTKMTPLFGVCQGLFGFLEQIASGEIKSPKAAYEACKQCRREAIRIREEFGTSGVHLQFFDALGWFLTKLLQRLNALSKLGQIEPEDDVPAEIIGLLTAESFTGVGADLLSLLKAADRQCRSFREEIVGIASESSREPIREKAWLRLSLQCNSLTFDFKNVSSDLARSMLGWDSDTRDQFRRTLECFRQFVERQAAEDILNKGNPQESIGRALLQAYLTSRSYREVPIRGGKCDILSFTKDGKRVVFEVKIWRGGEYYNQGLREIGEYLEGEGNDENYLGAFYVLFDPTKSRRASAHLGARNSIRSIGKFAVEVIVVDIALPMPSKKGKY